MRSQSFILALLLVLPLGLGGCSSAPPVETDASAVRAEQKQPADLYVLRRGRHTDVVIEAAQIRGPLAELKKDFPDARYLVFGFGDRQYMLATHKNLLHALLAPLPGAGIMLVSGIRGTPAEVYGADHLAALPLRPAQLDAVADFIWASLQLDASGAVSPYLQGTYAGNIYYASSKTYDGLYTCNTWTAEALQAGGFPVRSGGVLFSGQVWEQVEALQAAGVAAPPAR
jgi:uncharacterized protein (TIGR02117 family)